MQSLSGRDSLLKCLIARELLWKSGGIEKPDPPCVGIARFEHAPGGVVRHEVIWAGDHLQIRTILRRNDMYGYPVASFGSPGWNPGSARPFISPERRMLRYS